MIERHHAVETTQVIAHARAEAGAPHGTAILAVTQTGGRGTRGRVWASGPGGLWLSVVLRPAVDTAVPLASVRIGLGLARDLESWVDQPIGLKWPNDLIARDRKLGGILCESRWQGDRLAWMVVGVGVNVRNELPDPLAGSAILLADLGYRGTADELADLVVTWVMAASEAQGPLDDAEMAAFTARDRLRGRELTGPEPGRAAGITRAGHLLVDRSDGTRAETVGSVTLAGLAPDESSR